MGFMLLLSGCKSLINVAEQMLQHGLKTGSGEHITVDTQTVKDTVEWAAKEAQDLKQKAASGAAAVQKVQSGANKIIQGVNEIKKAVQ